MKRELMGRRELAKPDDHSMAHHLVTYSANNMVAPLTHAQIARGEYEDACDARDDLVTERDAMQARLDEAVALLHHAEATLSRCAGLGRCIPRPTQHEVIAEIETFRAFFSTLKNGGA